MDPITAAVVAAAAAGLADVAKKAIADAYSGLKDAIKRKFGDHSEIVKAVEGVETDPNAPGNRLILQGQVANSKADQDPEIRQAAKTVMDKIAEQPGGQ